MKSIGTPTSIFLLQVILILKIVLGDSSQVEDREIWRPGIELQTRHLLYDFREIRESERLDLIAGEGGNRNRHVLKILFTLLRANNNLLENLRVRQGWYTCQRNGQYGIQDA